MWPIQVKYRKLAQVRLDNINEYLHENFINVQGNTQGIFEEIVKKYRYRMDESYETICSSWRGMDGQIGSDTIRSELMKARETGFSTTKRFEEIKEKALKIHIKSKFLFRGVMPAYEYAEVEQLTSTSLSIERAHHYGLNPFMVIYVPDENVYGVPIFCKRPGFGTNRDVEILLVNPIIEEITGNTEEIREMFVPWTDVRIYVYKGHHLY